MTWTADDLIQLLPELYRVRDAETGGALAGLLAVVAEQLSLVEDDVDQLYDDWFIETCREWLAPYIGDLLRVRPPEPVTAGTASSRAFVANTIRYRRAKGTVAVLERLARDVTGWSARVVEYFQLVGTTQYVKHVRPGNLRTPSLRDGAALDRLGGPFDAAARTLEVRRPARGGRWNVPNVGVHLWRLQSYPLERVTPRPAAGRPLAWMCSPLGLDTPLFNPAPDAPPDGRLAGPR
ncbi:MAG TPA: hypothetical protein VOB72_04655, partial [Candidatus Dormibacteraeota bacterium]|nr:hypothetical protein [Candidatus Dormibacteraeota bacterium]